MKWWEALKIWNQRRGDGMYCMAKKGTPEHAEVKAIQNEGKVETKKAKTVKPKIDKELGAKVKKAMEHPFMMKKKTVEKKEEDFEVGETQTFTKEELKKFAEIRRAKKAEKAAKIAAFMEKLKGKKKEKVREFLRAMIAKRAEKKAAAPEVMEGTPSEIGEKLLKKHLREVKEGKDLYNYLKNQMGRVVKYTLDPKIVDEQVNMFLFKVIGSKFKIYGKDYLKEGEAEKAMEAIYKDLMVMRDELKKTTKVKSIKDFDTK